MKREKFSIRRTTRGAVSACIAVIGLLPLLSVGQTAQADSLSAPVPADATGLAPSDAPVDSQSETIAIPSPVTHVADESKEVGYHEVTERGQAGSLVITETLDGKTVKKTEPTPTTEVFGTKPKVEEVVTEEATTEYVADDQLEAGKQEVVEDGTDGKTVTTTTYKLVSQDARLGQVDTTYTGKTPYTIDESKPLPSDKVVIDEAGIRGGEQAKRTDTSHRLILGTLEEMLEIVGGRDRLSVLWPSSGKDLSEHLKAYVEQQAFSEAQYADIKAAYLRFQTLLDQYSQEELLESISGGERGSIGPGPQKIELIGAGNTPFNRPTLAYQFQISSEAEQSFEQLREAYLKHLDDIDAPNVSLLPEESEHLPILAGTERNTYVFQDGSVRRILVEEARDALTGQRVYNLGLSYQYESDSYGPAETTRKKRYLDYLRASGVVVDVIDDNTVLIDGVTYSFKMDGIFGTRIFNSSPKPEQILKHMATTHIAFETLTKYYNNLRGESDDLNVVYTTQLMPEEEKTWFNQQLAKLPTALKKHLVRLVVQDDVVNDNESTRGVAQGGTKEIQLRYPKAGSKEDLLRIFLHELSHVLDNRAEKLSGSKEFSEFYYSYINPPISESDKAVKDYYQDYLHEAFAEHFGQYLLKRLYGYDYTRYINIDGRLLTLRPYDFMDNDESVEKGREYVASYYNDPRAYSPVEAAEWFFDKLYTQLFEQETEGKVLIDTVKTQTHEVKKGLVRVGTKPKVVDAVTKYTTKEIEEPTLLLGERRVIQRGQDGLTRTTTTYELADQTTGRVRESTSSQTVQDMIEEIILIGTKKATETPQPSPKPQPELGDQKDQVTSPIQKEKPLTRPLTTNISQPTTQNVNSGATLTTASQSLVSASAPQKVTNQEGTSTSGSQPVLPKTGEKGSYALVAIGVTLTLSSLGLTHRRKAD